MGNTVSVQQSIINDIVTKLQFQQEELIKQKLIEYLGYELDVIAESKRRFPRLGIFHQDNEISYYWNDGSQFGHRLITFVSSNVDYSDIENYKLKCDIKYY